MLTTIRQVNEEFFRTFYGLKVTVGGSEKVLLCRYAKKSSRDYVEEQENQIYPCIAIQDYTPVPKKEWYIDMKEYFGGKSLDGLKGYLYQRPIWMEFRYDVSAVAKSYNDFMSIQDYFMENFVYGKRFVFNAKLSGDNLVGDIVPYEVRCTDVPRTDGVFEMNYEFTCSVWLYPRTPEEVTLVQNIVITLYRKSIPNDSDFVTSDGKVFVTSDEKVLDSTFRSHYSSEDIERIFDTAVLSDDVDRIVDLGTSEPPEDADERTLYINRE